MTSPAHARPAPLVASPEWSGLLAHRAAMAGTAVRDLFAADPQRFERFSLAAGPLFLDFSRHCATRETLELLLALAKARDVAGWRARMFAGEAINTTENRAVLHVALRGHGNGSEADQVREQARAVLSRMGEMAREIRAGAWRGASGAPITDIIHIGIGGSDFGPRLIDAALKVDHPGPRVHFVANVDPDDLADAVAT